MIKKYATGDKTFTYINFANIQLVHDNLNEVVVVMVSDYEIVFQKNVEIHNAKTFLKDYDEYVLAVRKKFNDRMR